jgi:SPP1 gp7 family putative phage head morphogenesis protein
MSTRQFLKNASARHAVFVQRFAGGQVRELLPLLKRLQKDVANELKKLDELTDIRRDRLLQIYRDLESLTDKVYEKFQKKIEKSMTGFARYEAEFTKRMVDKGSSAEFNLPSTEQIKAALNTNIMDYVPTEGRGTIGDALSSFRKKKRKQIVQTLRDGIVLGKSNGEIIRDLNSIQAQQHRNQAEALVRTVTNHVSTVARMETLKENADVLEGYEVVATLDSQTTIICAGLDGKVYPIGEEVWPPYHWGCRTTLIPRVKPEYDLFSKVEGERPSIGKSGAETVRAGQSFGTWLDNQGSTFQKEYFFKQPDGEARYALWKRGGLKIDQFTDSRQATYSLDELKRLYPVAFDKAGLDD